MGSADPPRQTATQNAAPVGPDGAPRPLVAFDFDGTLTIRDTFPVFLAWRTDPLRWLLGHIRLIPATLDFSRHHDRGRLKAAMARVFLRAIPMERAREEAGRFALARSGALLRPDALACWRGWRERGARLVIVSASPEFLVAPFAQALGADHLIATRFELDAQGLFTGALEGRNCRNAEKVARLEDIFGPGFQLQAAYGDSDGDVQMLAKAREGFMKVFTGKP